MNSVIFMAYYDIALQRKQEIENNLLNLMGQIPYNRITVKDLTDNLQIARKTFYHYFHNKQACLESLMDRMILESSLSLISLPQQASLQEIQQERLLFWRRNKAFLEAVYRNHLSFVFIERAMLYVLREDPTIQNQRSAHALIWDEDLLYGYISGQICLILKWCQDGFNRPLEEMIQISLQLALEPVVPHNQETD